MTRQEIRKYRIICDLCKKEAKYTSYTGLDTNRILNGWIIKSWKEHWKEYYDSTYKIDLCPDCADKHETPVGAKDVRINTSTITGNLSDE